MDDEAGAGLGLPLQRTAQRFQALSHAAQAVTFGSIGAAAVVGDLKRAKIILLAQANTTLLRLSVAHDVGYGLAQRQSEHLLLRRAQRQPPSLSASAFRCR